MLFQEVLNDPALDTNANRNELAGVLLSSGRIQQTIKLYDGRHGGYTTVEVTPDLWRADFYAVDNMEDPASTVLHVGTFVTENGGAGVTSA